MPVSVEKLPDEAIIISTFSPPFNPVQDMPAMFQAIMQLGMEGVGRFVLIHDLSAITGGGFAEMVLAMGEAAALRRQAPLPLASPPVLIFVGQGSSLEIAVNAMEQEQYGGSKAYLCATRDEASALARERLANS